MADYYHLTLHVNLQPPPRTVSSDTKAFDDLLADIEDNHVIDSSSHQGSVFFERHHDMDKLKATLVTHLNQRRHPEEMTSILERLDPYVIRGRLYGTLVSPEGSLEVLWHDGESVHIDSMEAPWI